MKKFCLVFVLLACGFVGLTFVGCGKAGAVLNSYNIVCAYDDASKTLDCQQTVDYVNNSDNLLSQVRFHLYPNAFRQGAKAKVVSTTSKSRAYYNGDSFGGIQISSVGGQNVQGFEVGGDDQNILIVSLENGIYPNERVKIEMEYVVTLPNVNHRFGYGENTINFGNFYPIACVYENGKGFVQDLYHSNGDPFYSDCANYDVTISYPSVFTLASSGQQKSTQNAENVCSTSVHAAKVRDFAFVLSPKFEKITESADGLEINYFFYDDQDAAKSMQVAVDAIKTFDKLFGKYPYAQLSVVEANFVHGGMEYPNLVLISDAVESAEEYAYVIVHEIAHQWWYGTVGNNEYVGAWQDEGLAEYSTLLFYEQNPQYDTNYDDMIRAANTSYKHFVEIYSRYYDDFDTSMDRRLDQFATEPEYTNCTYTKGTLMFDCLRQTIGEKKFLKGLKKYYKDFSFKNASNEDFIRSFIDGSGVDLESFFASWLDGSVVIL